MNNSQDAEKGRPARPQRAKSEEVRTHFVGPFARAIDLGERKSPFNASDLRTTLVEPLSDARTPLVDFFSILRGLNETFEQQRLGGYAPRSKSFPVRIGNHTEAY